MEQLSKKSKSIWKTESIFYEQTSIQADNVQVCNYMFGFVAFVIHKSIHIVTTIGYKKNKKTNRVNI